MKKIALFGGSFDPIHTDHINIIQTCHDQLGFEEVWIIPTHISPFKFQTQATDEQRIAMIKLGTAHLPYVHIKKYEINQRTHSYTYRTVLHYHNKYPDCDFSFIIGSDQLDRFEEWDHFTSLVKLIKFKVFKRTTQINESIIKRYNLELFTFDNNFLSSTDVRQGHNLAKQLPILNDYINYHLLYLKDRLASQMDEHRYEHSLNVGECAAILAERYGVDPIKARFAGTFHDVAKRWSEQRQAEYIQRYFPALISEPKPTWHGYAAYGYLKDDLQIRDEAVLLAVKNHTTGSGTDMSDLAKIVFIADKISQERNYPNVQYYRSLSLISLEECFKQLLINQYEVAVQKHGLNAIGGQIIRSYNYWVLNQGE